MIRKLEIIFLLVLIFSFSASPSYALSTYVLPYPSTMPGGIAYKIHLVEEAILKYWYFGDFGQFNYNLKESDKYLVEAKTLFEYNQYLLGFKALEKSDLYFKNTLPQLVKAKVHGKNISSYRALLNEASQKHIEVLTQLKNEVPESFTWTPEKALPTKLDLKNSLENSIKVRENYL